MSAPGAGREGAAADHQVLDVGCAPMLRRGGGAAMSDAQSLTLALRGRWYGRYGLAFCPVHDNRRTPALRLADGCDGRLLALCSAGCTFESVVDVLRGMGLLAGRVRGAVPDLLVQLRRQADQGAFAERRRRQAIELWQTAVGVAGTLAERYLRARSITAVLPRTLRFHGACWHASGRRLPALLALVEKAGLAEPVGVHRIYLTEPGCKADIAPVKASLGPVGGGAVWLGVGRIGSVEAGQRRALGEPVVVAEGIETALSLPPTLLGSSPSILATLSTSGMTGLALPGGQPGRLVITPDNDSAGRKAATTLADRACALGWTVQYLRPPSHQKDWNDVLQERATTS